MERINALWPRDGYDHPDTLRLHEALQRPRLALAIVRYMLRARRDGVFTFGRTCTTHFGAQRPSSFRRETRARQWYRFLTECFLPTVFVKPDLYEVGGYFAEGCEFTFYLWVVGKGWTFGAGRRGALMYEPPPADEYDFPDYLPDDEEGDEYELEDYGEVL